jgi:hypothetical protein
MCALRYFLDKTTELGAIAFFQWRYRFPTMYTNEEDLVEILEQRLGLLFDPLKPLSEDPKKTFQSYKATTEAFSKLYHHIFD